MRVRERRYTHFNPMGVLLSATPNKLFSFRLAPAAAGSSLACPVSPVPRLFALDEISSDSLYRSQSESELPSSSPEFPNEDRLAASSSPSSPPRPAQRKSSQTLNFQPLNPNLEEIFEPTEMSGGGRYPDMEDHIHVRKSKNPCSKPEGGMTRRRYDL